MQDNSVNPSPRERLVQWEDPKAIVEMSRGLSGLEFLSGIRDGSIPPPPFATLLGVRIVQVAKGVVVFEADPAEEHYNASGVAHGGFVMALLDFALGSAINSTLPDNSGCRTIDVHARLLRPVTKEAGTVRCEARIVSATRSLATSEGRLVDGNGAVLATGTSACAIYSPPANSEVAP